MENLVTDKSFWCGRRVFLTGHTGFKGGWLSIWLKKLGAEVYGYALAPPTEPNLFSVCQVENRLVQSTIADIRDVGALGKAMRAASPQVVFHLAAQPLVRESYVTPVETFATNVLGTVNLLDAARRTGGVNAIVNVTTDKVYQNREWLWPYRENEPVGGLDPYSSSKACAELATAAYRDSFLAANKVHTATARAGNVIGGGDWAEDRLLPDFLRALDAGSPIEIRSPKAVRPWQHVLEPLAGYLLLAEVLSRHGAAFAEAWNFGPEEADCRTVEWIMNRLCAQCPGAGWTYDSKPKPHESMMLRLDSSKAKAELGWRPVWDLGSALGMTLEWHRAWRDGADMLDQSVAQITAYEEARGAL